jgi:Protein of unknown function (DUF732)
MLRAFLVASKLRQLAMCALVGALGAVGLLAAPSAQADPVDFIYHTDMLGIDNANLTVGWSICSDIASGYSQDTIARDLVYRSFLGNGIYDHITYDQAYNEVYWAQQDLCPWTAGTGIAA